jgi:hypothetical protein
MTTTRGISKAVDELRDLHPNARITVTLGTQRYGVTVDARTIVKDFDSAAADAAHWKAEALKWQGLATRLSDRLVAEAPVGS